MQEAASIIMRKLSCIVVAFFLVLVPVATHAEIVSYNFSGIIYDNWGWNYPNGTPPIGTQLFGNVIYDTTVIGVPDEVFPSWNYNFFNALLSLTINVGGYSLFGNGGRVYISQTPETQQSGIGFQAYGFYGSMLNGSIGGYYLNEISLALRSPASTLPNGFSIPIDLSFFNSYLNSITLDARYDVISPNYVNGVPEGRLVGTAYLTSLTRVPVLQPVTGKTYGLFVGVRDYALKEAFWGIKLPTIVHMDTSATNIMNQMRIAYGPGFEGTLLTADRTLGVGISKEWLRNEIRLIESKIRPNDRFIIYIGSHGSSKLTGDETTISSGDEFLRIAPWTYPYFSEAYDAAYDDLQLSDNELFEFLNTPRLNQMPKWVFLESCHSGGFWGNRNNADSGDLEKLQNIFLFAAAAENQNAFADQNGYGIWGQALYEAFSKDSSGAFIADTNPHDGFLSPQEIRDAIQAYTFGNGQHLIGSVVYPLDYGDPYIFTEDTWNPVTFASPDFNDAVSQTLFCIPVQIQIKSEDLVNSINISSGGVTSLSIKSSDDFDATALDPNSIKFGNASPIRWHLRDVNHDNKIDVVLQFRTEELALSKNTKFVGISGLTYDGKCFNGTDTVKIVESNGKN